MNQLHADIQEKKAEAVQMMEIISRISSMNGAIVKTAILKSSFVLLLYNAIESTVFSVFDRIHEELSGESYLALNSKVRKIWVDYYFSSHAPGSHYDNLEKTLEQTLRLPLLEEFMGRVKLFSGNLDARKIDGLLSKYGIGAIRAIDKGKLVTIKNRRNTLSHGEKMFKQACRDLSENDLNSLKSATFSTLDDLVAQVDLYLKNKKYLAAPLA